MSIISKQTERLISEAIERGYRQWDEGSCHERDCGCVTEYIRMSVCAALNGDIPISQTTENQVDWASLGRTEGNGHRLIDELGGYPGRCVHSRPLDIECKSCREAIR